MKNSVIVDGLNAMRDEAHDCSKSKGWWDADMPFNVSEKLALIHSEVSEALEDYRVTGLSEKLAEHIYEQRLPTLPTTKEFVGENGKLNKPIGFASELADIIIRVGDLAGKLGIDLGRAVEEKHAFNRTRSHRHGGKVA
jgi:NTP pyrophosphatase (non-canonical NTP hydrolase)